MSLEQVAADARAVRDVPLEDRLLAAAAVGEAIERELTDADVLVETSSRVAEVAQQLGCAALLGASPVGDRLAAAAVALARNGLHLYRSPSNGDGVLIIDGTLVTGSQIASAARRAHQDGVRHAAAVVVCATGQVELANIVDQVVVLET